MDNYGAELILDLHDCDPRKFTRENIQNFFDTLCCRIKMEQCDLHWWDDLFTPESEKETDPKLVGTSAIQFIKTSNITIHTLDIMKRVYLNIFSCKDFDRHVAEATCHEYFDGTIMQSTLIRRY